MLTKEKEMLTVEEQMKVYKRCEKRICIAECSFRAHNITRIDNGKMQITLTSTGRVVGDIRNYLEKIVFSSCQREVRDLARLALKEL